MTNVDGMTSFDPLICSALTQSLDCASPTLYPCSSPLSQPLGARVLAQPVSPFFFSSSSIRPSHHLTSPPSDHSTISPSGHRHSRYLASTHSLPYMRPSPSTCLIQMISKPDSLTSELQDECYFSYSHASSNQSRLRRTQRPRPTHPLKPSDQPPQTARNNIPAGSSPALHPSICPAPSGQLPAPSPPQSRSPPDCACPRLFKVQEPLTPALTVAPTPIYAVSTVVGAQAGHQASPETSQIRDVTNGAPCIFPRKSTHHAPCPHALRRQHPPASLNVGTVEVLRIACKHIPPRIVPAPPPLSSRLRAKWATIQAAEALVKEVDDSSRQAESCTKLPRRKRTIRRPGPAQDALPAQDAPPAQDALPAQDVLPTQDVLPAQEVAPH